VIVHEIRKPEPVAQFPRQQAANEYDNGVARYMPKIEFAKWIESVKRQWKQGDWVTIQSAPILEGLAPKVCFRINGIQEIHWMAPLDKSCNEPRALNIVGRAGVTLNYPPCKLRHMTEDEVRIVAVSTSQEGGKVMVAGTDNDGNPIIYPINEPPRTE
jgi:hypothetical protein